MMNNISKKIMCTNNLMSKYSKTWKYNKIKITKLINFIIKLIKKQKYKLINQKTKIKKCKMIQKMSLKLFY